MAYKAILFLLTLPSPGGLPGFFYPLYFLPMSKTDQTPALAPVVATAIKPYQKRHETTDAIVDKYKYLTGHPRQYRFDAKAGVFNINGVDVVGKTLTFQPFAWRIFTDDILNMGQKNWAELFFIDKKGCVSALLFHGYSVDNLFSLIEPLYYDDLTLADVVITTVAAPKTRKGEEGGKYFIAEFTYAPAPADQVAELREYATDRQIFRAGTLTDLAKIKTSHKYHNPLEHGDAAALGIAPPADVDTESGEVIQST